MLEGLVAWVLNNYLGRYVENLNTDQLSIALLSGEVELENLPLRRDALRHLGAPIEIRAGFVGKVRLSIPLRQPRSAPWVISLERLYMVAGPVRLEHWEDAAEKMAEHERKLSALDALEACWRQEREARASGSPGIASPTGNGPGSYYASSYASWLSYGTGLISDIVENIQLKVERVHVRYEDGPGGACGITIRSLSAQSCDKDWKTQFTHRTADQPYSYKTVDLTEMSVYWESPGSREPMSDMSMEELAAAMEMTELHKRTHIVAPVSGYAHVSRNRSEQPLRSASEPRVVCELCLDSVPVFLADWQHELAARAYNTLDYVAEMQRQRRYRPSTHPSDDPVRWWAYALRSAGSDIYPRRNVRSWDRVLQLASENVRYVRMYERLLAQPSAALSHEDKQLKEQVEWTRDVEQLRALRQAAMRRVQAAAPPPASPTAPSSDSARGRSVLAGWFPQWWGWYSTESPAEKSDEKITAVDKNPAEEELLEILSDAVRDNTVLKRDVVFGRFTFGLKSGALALCTGPEIKPAMELQFEGFQLTIESRPRSGSYSLELALGTLRLRDLLTEGTLFPALISERGTSLGASSSTNTQEPLFKLRFEALARGARRLKVKSRPLEVVYQPAASRWLIAFACGPHRRAATEEDIEAVKARTKEQLMRNWESIVDGKDLPDRPVHAWDLHLDISAPQIIFVESFCAANATIGVVDLGRLHVTNAPDFQNEPGAAEAAKKPIELAMEEEEEETFATPCSTPPGSEASASVGTETMATAATDLPLLDETALHSRLYERYSAELTDMQVLTCRVRDGWRHAHTRGSSSMHVLERFSISACLERRLVRTQDPMYPALALSGQLPRLVLHINEHKATAIRTLVKVLDPPPDTEKATSRCRDRASDDRSDDGPSVSSEDATTTSDAWQSSRLLMLQFTVEHASVQLQSRGRSVAELQISGASATLTRRPLDTSLTVTVHGLLLVDALQTYGPDFELLVASHRHVAMDSVSGSLRDSEPTSPCSPGSPDPYQATITSPSAITTALSGLTASSPPPGVHEALICIEYTMVDGVEPVRIANIQFNNLDVIANQETVVELVGFARRVFPSSGRQVRATTYSSRSFDDAERDSSSVRIELTFDFHRLNVLLMRGVRDDAGDAAGRKVATLSACGARIRATVDGDVATVNGSLDGLQLLDLTAEGRTHRRIVSVGRDPLEDVLPHGLYRVHQDESAPRAFEAAAHRTQPNRLDLEVRMASVWYTHSPRLLSELQLCAAEFKHYLSDVASRISAAAADVVVHQLYGHRGSVHGHVTSSTDSISGIGTAISPDEDAEPKLKITIDVVLDSPVVVLPRNPTSAQVFVAHLGRITIVNSRSASASDDFEAYEIDFRDMNLYSLDTGPRRMPGPGVPRADKLYSCDTLAEPVLHDTILHVNVVTSDGRDLDRDEGVLLEDADSPSASERLEVTGSVVSELRVSLTRQQYEQLLDTFQSLTDDSGIENTSIEKRKRLHDIAEEEVGVGTLRMDQHVRAGMFPTAVGRAASAARSFRQLHLGFELPVFTVELRRDASAVELSFIEFAFDLEKSVPHETNVQVSLRSLRMDDLKHPRGNRVRCMVASRNAAQRRAPQSAAFASHSFPERFSTPAAGGFGSLPDHLEAHAVLGAPPPPRRRPAPPDHPRPLTDNLVLISSLIVDPACAPDFQKRYGSLQRSTHVDFNALDLSVKSDSWGLVFDFFGGNGDAADAAQDDDSTIARADVSAGGESEPVRPDAEPRDSKNELTISVRSLAVTFLLEDGKEIARSNISGVQLKRASNLKDSSSEMDGRLGSMTINDLTEHGKLYRERFRTLGERALHFRYCSSPSGCSLRLEMATVLYVHTRRFSTELQSCLSGFGGRSGQNKQPDVKQQGAWTSLEIQAGAPVILLPVSSSSEHILVADLGKLVVSNQLNCRAGRLLDVMKIELLDMDLYAARRVVGGCGFDTGNGVSVERCGRSLLDDKCRLELVVERGLNEGAAEEADLSVRGDLSALRVGLDLQQYRLIRGLLAHNIGEALDDQHRPQTHRGVPGSCGGSVGDRSTITVIRLGLQDVTVRLSEDSGAAVGSVHFISSRLLLESFSDGTQDVDLLSQEILLVDARPDGGNAFTDILSPGGGAEPDGMQAEVHSRRQADSSEFTVLLNNMRVMLIPDWWRAATAYVFSPPMESERGAADESASRVDRATEEPPAPSYEFKLNVTNSEIVVVQDTASRGTNALTLRSTTVLSYRPNEDKPLTCNLNHCELFSCVPGREDDTALSIIDPVTVGVELNSKGELEVQLQHRLNVRLSYHDTRMLADMVANVPEQLWSDGADADGREVESTRRLTALGFAADDCREALEACRGQLEEAAVWLTENKIHRSEEAARRLVWSTLTVQANLLVLTVIDDCGDADVPLAELCLSNVSASRPLGDGGGAESWLRCQLSCDYYNRALSGWEPCVEPWNCDVTWETGTRLIVHVASGSLLDVTVTSALLDLYRLVSDSWGTDMQKPLARRRTRFVPFALKNDTGCTIYFNTVTSKLEDQEEDSFEISLTLPLNSNWRPAEPGDTVPFDFGDSHSGRRRHGDTHRPRLHILSVRVAGWTQTARVSVDRVGVYFREVGGRESGEPARTRLVFDVRLEGSARKLVTVRSALMLENLLSDSVDVRLGASAELTVESGGKVPVPLEHSHQRLHVKPKMRANGPNYAFCQPDVDWRSSVQKPGERKHEARRCVSGGRYTGVYHLCVETRREHYPSDATLPAHTVSLIPALLVVNLLPHELHFDVAQETVNLSQSAGSPPEGFVKAGGELAVPSADPSCDRAELRISLDGFRCKTGIRIPSIDSPNEQQSRVRLEDASGRRLNLRANVSVCSSSAGVRIAVSAPYWIVNRTGLPLVFRQEGVSADAAGQFEENEVARMVAPLLFSWADEEASPSVVCRVGNAAVVGGQPQWCQPFHLRRGVQVRRLKVSQPATGGGPTRPDTIYVLGIEVRPGKGRYRRTSIVTLSPRHQIHNRTNCTLIFSQRCHATSVRDPGASATHVVAVSGCQLPFHWPRLDHDQLLCVKMETGTFTPWSGGLRIDQPRSLHVCLRDSHGGEIKFLRLEVLPRGSTMHAVFSDPADTLPPPMRVDNLSEVTITFAQQDVTQACVARPRASVPYAWDEPDRGYQSLVVTAPGGATAACDMDRLGPVAQLTYENFIYVAFSGTFPEDDGVRDVQETRIDDQRLVLDVSEDGRVSLAPKQPGRRSQLWRMTSTGQLQHEGSPADRTLVLDIEGPAPQPAKRDSRLALRRPDPRRRSTQTWRFTSEGRLCCAHDNMCVQSQEGLFGLRSGGAAVLGVTREPPLHRSMLHHKVPAEQAVGKQRMRPGSGFLTVEITTDGPTRVLCVRDDIAERRKRNSQASPLAEDSTSIPGLEIRVVVRLTEGVGLSIVGGGPPQELLYARLSGIVAEAASSPGTPGTRQLCLSVADVQCDNQLFDTDTEVIVYASPKMRTTNLAEWQGPALSISAELQPPLPRASVIIFRHLVVKVNPLSLHVDETLLLRLMEFASGTGRGEAGVKDEREGEDDDDETKPGADTAATSAHTRYYIGVMSLSPGPVRLSMRTAGKLPQRLRALRRRLGLTLIQFEDASICVEPYVRRHLFDTARGLWRGVHAHFREELVWQAAVILGNVDFLGGPLGLVSDVTEGVSGLINERSVGALFMNVTHGLSNSAAKVTDALGDGLGRVLIMDEAHEEARQRIRRAGGGGSHLVAGIKGLGFGLLDGATGLFRHVYEGAANDGVQGAFAGVGRGLVGMVAKPVVGVLDFAGETARAVRDSSRGSARQTPVRKREPRVAALGPGGLLPRYGSGKEARGQKYLHKLNGGDLTERFVAYGSLRSSEIDDLRLVLGSEKVRVVTQPGSDVTIVTEVKLEDVLTCGPVTEENRNYVELTVRAGASDAPSMRRPRIRCDTQDVALWAARQINFARKMLSERRYTLRAPDGGDAASTPQ